MWLLLMPAAIIIVWIWRKQADPRAQWRDIIEPQLLEHLLVGQKTGVRFKPIHWAAAVIMLGGIAAAGPTWEKEPPPFVEDHALMVVALDLSRTMDAVDVPPTRLERAKQKVRDLAALRSGSRTGLVVYAGTAHLVLPPTEDPELLDLFLGALDTGLMPVSGRHPAEALALADHVLAVESAPGTILFITDGLEETEIPAFIAHSQQSSHQVIALVAGTSQGGPIRGARGRFVTDAHGKPLHAGLDREVFSRLSSAAGVPVASLTIDKTDVEWVQQRALHHLQVMEEKNADVRWREFGYFGTFPLLLLAGFWFRRGWTVRWTPGLVLPLIVATALCLPEPAGANFRFIDLFLTPDQQGRWYFEHGDYVTSAQRYQDPLWKGLAYYRAGDSASALAQFAGLDSAEAFFLMGNCYARRRDYPAAVGAYDNALKRREVFPEATENRRLVASLIPRKPKPPEEGEADPNLDPDDIKFDEKGKRGKPGKIPQFKIQPDQMAKLWMRNLHVSPAAFLREKFRIEADAQTKKPKGPP